MVLNADAASNLKWGDLGKAWNSGREMKKTPEENMGKTFSRKPIPKTRIATTLSYITCTYIHIYMYTMLYKRITTCLLKYKTQ